MSEKATDTFSSHDGIYHQLIQQVKTRGEQDLYHQDLLPPMSIESGLVYLPQNGVGWKDPQGQAGSTDLHFWKMQGTSPNFVSLPVVAVQHLGIQPGVMYLDSNSHPIAGCLSMMQCFQVVLQATSQLKFLGFRLPALTPVLHPVPGPFRIASRDRSNSHLCPNQTNQSEAFLQHQNTVPTAPKTDLYLQPLAVDWWLAFFSILRGKKIYIYIISKNFDLRLNTIINIILMADPSPSSSSPCSFARMSSVLVP